LSVETLRQVVLDSFRDASDRSRPRGPRMQDIDRPRYIQALSEPPRPRRLRVDVESVLNVRGAEGPKRIGGHHWRTRDVGEHSAVRPPELQRAVGLSGDLIALFVHGAMSARFESVVGPPAAQ